MLAYDVISDLDNVDADGDDVKKGVVLAHMMVEVKPSLYKVNWSLLKNNDEATNNFS